MLLGSIITPSNLHLIQPKALLPLDIFARRLKTGGEPWAERDGDCSGPLLSLIAQWKRRWCLAMQSRLKSHLLWYVTCVKIYPSVHHS